jgi:Ca2+-binding RTX toxin-like protein
MDMDGMESIDLRTLGGTDNVVIGDLSGTDLTQIGIDLRDPNGGSDGNVDAVTVNATNGGDVFSVTGVQVFGLQAVVNMFHTDADDRLTLNGLGGDDVIDASSLEAGAVQLTKNGGLGNDLFLGSEGDDLINGGDGDDVLIGGDGNDTVLGEAGDDVLLGGLGLDIPDGGAGDNILIQ